jgi:DNA-binding transcriptional LysR family regulator
MIDPRQEFMPPPPQDPAPRTSEPLRQFEDFLRALCDPEGGIALHRMHASRAAVRHGVGWCTLAARVESWSYRDGLLQSLADYPWMRNGTPSPARALLDAGYFRRYWRAPVTFHTLPASHP